MLGRKQNTPDVDAWTAAREAAVRTYTPAAIDALLDTAADRILAATPNRRAALAWSGGKDSLVCELAARRAGIDDAVLVISRLEYPAFLAWATLNMPDGLTIVCRDQINETWLAAHPRMLFPHGNDGAAWFRHVQHAGQRDYARATGAALILGRRTADGNHVGDPLPGGARGYTDRAGTTRISPIHDWPHEAVLAAIHHHRIDLPPCYSWPRGWQVGTGAWPARQWTTSRAHGWSEVWTIDPEIVHRAAHLDLPDARHALHHLERGDDPCAASA